MTFPHDVLITEPVTVDTFDSESGRPTGSPTESTVYSGKGWFQRNRRRTNSGSTGDKADRSEAQLFLPKGSHGVRRDHRVYVDDCFEGVIKETDDYHHRFYSWSRVEKDEKFTGQAN